MSEHIDTWVLLSIPPLVYFCPFRGYLHSSFRVETPKFIFCRFEGFFSYLFSLYFETLHAGKKPSEGCAPA